LIKIWWKEYLDPPRLSEWVLFMTKFLTCHVSVSDWTILAFRCPLCDLPGLICRGSTVCILTRGIDSMGVGHTCFNRRNGNLWIHFHLAYSTTVLQSSTVPVWYDELTALRPSGHANEKKTVTILSLQTAL
jgi:hypothetical protein